MNTMSIEDGIYVVDKIYTSYQSKSMKFMMEACLQYGFTTDVTFKINKIYNTCISMVYCRLIGRAVPVLVTFMKGEAAEDYFSHFQYIANFICLIDPVFRSKFRVSFDWSVTQYNRFKHVYHTHAL